MPGLHCLEYVLPEIVSATAHDSHVDLEPSIASATINLSWNLIVKHCVNFLSKRLMAVSMMSYTCLSHWHHRIIIAALVNVCWYVNWESIEHWSVECSYMQIFTILYYKLLHDKIDSHCLSSLRQKHLSRHYQFSKAWQTDDIRMI